MKDKMRGNLTNVEGTIEDIEGISDRINRKDYLTAAVITEMLPESINKDPIYAILAIELTKLSESKDSGLGNESRELVKRLADVYKTKTSYFK